MKNKDEAEDPRMQEALVKMLQHNRELHHIEQWLLHNGMVTQKNFVGLCRGFSLISPSQSFANSELILSFLLYCSKHAAGTVLKDEFELMKPHFEAALLKSYTYSKSQHVSISVWWASVRDRVGDVLGVADFETCLACSTKWEDVKDALGRVCSTTVGAKIFAGAQRQLAESMASNILQQAVGQFSELKDIGLESTSKIQREI